MTMESLIKAVVMLHNGHKKEKTAMEMSILKQIEINTIHQVTLDGKPVDALELILTAKYNPFVMKEGFAVREVDAAVALVTSAEDDGIIFAKQFNTTRCELTDGEPDIDSEVLIEQSNKTMTIDEYAKICKEFELYFE